MSQLVVRREDIVFRDVGPGRVSVEIAVHNEGEEPTESTMAIVQSAPLGAFVRWRPLSVAQIPALEPGASVAVEFEARRPSVSTLGDPRKIEPLTLLTALDNDDDRQARSAFGALPADLLELFGRRNLYWAGNLNIFIGARSVERHVAQALRIYPGRVNAAMFLVGEGRDAYSFSLIGVATAWDTALYHWRIPGLEHARDNPPAAFDQWIELHCMEPMLLAMIPPQGCAEGDVQVHVRQKSSGREAVVEFSFDPAAVGPGCYAVA
ncbi:MAG: hypothetical protein L0Y72_08165 [Gemmataceae bacterium]|nr:hypothetical protein [Gemmataceae bacterium]